MNPSVRQERTTGWALAIMVLIHLFTTRPQPAVALGCFSLLLLGAVLRERNVFIPNWLGYALLPVGATLVVLAEGALSLSFYGELAAVLAAILLLRPVTPARGQWIILFLIIILVLALLRFDASVGLTFIILDVAAMLILTEQMHRPPEMAVSFWVSVARSFRVIVPVGIVVTGIFWLFPNFTIYTPPVLTGFSGSGMMLPGDIAQIARSRRVALTARFTKDQALPAPHFIYWRGRVLENNDGLSWYVVKRRFDRPPILKSEVPSEGETILRYSQDLVSNRGGIVPVLDHAVYVDASRNGEDIAIPELGAGVLSAVTGPVELTAYASLSNMTDVPQETIAGGALMMPQKLRESGSLQKIVNKIFANAPPTTEGRLQALTRYWREGGFEYSSRPDRILTLYDFLTKNRRGFCEHYAAASAALLRLAGVPSRVVTGFRGGEWSPWLRTITVRDADAHAWVEAWDEPTQQWLRYEPSDVVKPDLLSHIEAEMDAERWPWYRRAWRFSQAAATLSTTTISDVWVQITSLEFWENANVYLFSTLVCIGVFWLIRNQLRRRASDSAEEAIRLLGDLEYQAARRHRRRRSGETPLAWLRRLRNQTTAQTEQKFLQEVAALYETAVYAAQTDDSEAIPKLRQEIKSLTRHWKRARLAT